jgi:molybdopterin synthase catalytic subunit
MEEILAVEEEQPMPFWKKEALAKGYRWVEKNRPG